VSLASQVTAHTRLQQNRPVLVASEKKYKEIVSVAKDFKNIFAKKDRKYSSIDDQNSAF
jgi:hypothetical protein